MSEAATAELPVSVVIPTYRRRSSVERLLAALDQQTFPPDRFEAVVSIDGSEDGTRESVAAHACRYALRSVWQPNAGRASACNAGIRASRGRVVVLLDDDMEPTPEFLDAHVRAHAAAPPRGVLGAVPVAVTEDSTPVVRFIAEGFAKHLQKLARPEHRIGIRDFYSGNFSIERDAICRVGLFDEAFREYGNEDGELAIRLREAGIELVYSTEALAYQHYEKDFPALAKDKMAQGRTSVLSAAAHLDRVREMRIGTYRGGSTKWRIVRSLLLLVSRIVPAVPRWVVEFVAKRERRGSPKLEGYYALALDYFYWLGVRSALRDHPAARARLSL